MSVRKARTKARTGRRPDPPAKKKPSEVSTEKCLRLLRQDARANPSIADEYAKIIRGEYPQWKAKSPKSPKPWIQHAVRHPGRLRSAVMRIYGRKAGFDGQGRIRCSVLRELAHDPVYGRSARLALRLRGFVGVVCPVRGR